MFEKPLSFIINMLLKGIEKISKKQIPTITASQIEEVTIWSIFRGIRKLFEQLLSKLDNEVQQSIYSKYTDRALKTIFGRIPSIPFLRNVSFLRNEDTSALTSPLIFIVAFIAFMGLSDHGISAFALWSIIAALFCYYLGTLAARIKIKELPERSVRLLLPLFVITALGTYMVGDIAAKISLIPLFFLIFSNEHGEKISICVVLGGYALFSMGNITLGAPYIALGILGVARNLRTPKLAKLLENNAVVLATLLIIIGTLYWILDIALVGKIPLFTSREGLDPVFTTRSHLLPIGSILMVSLLGEWSKRTNEYGKARMLSLLLIAFSTALMALLGYRTQVLITLLAFILVAILWDLITVTEVFAAGTFLVIFFAGMTVMRTYTTGANVGLFESISLRAGLTLDVYDMMADLGGYLGFTKGQTYLASISSFATLMPGLAYSPRRYVAIFAGGEGISMTSTLLGPIALDFGFVGTIFIMLLFGFFIQRIYNLVKRTTGKRRSYMVFIYGMTLGYLLIGIETGIVDYEVLLLYAFSFLYMIYISRIS